VEGFSAMDTEKPISTIPIAMPAIIFFTIILGNLV
jgi:hypothetical protein